MAHTDRDDARWFWKDHFRWDKEAQASDHRCQWRGDGQTCWCETLPDAHKWAHPYRYETGVPSVWHRDQRRAERAHARNLMAQARGGHIDWDDLTIAYRRPYYW